jgi:hypothetical protein
VIPTTCFVLYEDLLAAKELLKTGDDRLPQWLHHVESVLAPYWAETYPNVAFHRYSDNFSFCVEAGTNDTDSMKAFGSLADISAWFHVTALTHCLQYRGVIAKGPMLTFPSDKPVGESTNATGTALSDAYKLAETSGGWGRCTVAQSAIEQAAN